ncbi:MAG: hypothetical protein ACTSSM_16695 [Promethearchaeota archaeon]
MAQYNAIYNEDLDIIELVKFGILKILLWISSKRSGAKEDMKILIPFIDDIIESIKLKKIKIKKPKTNLFLNEILENRDYNTLEFLKQLYELKVCCKKYFAIKNIPITRDLKFSKGIIGIYDELYYERCTIGINFIIKNDLFKILAEIIKKEIKIKTQKIVKILEYEKTYGKQPSDNELVRDFDIFINEIEEYKKLMNELPNESFNNDLDIMKTARKVGKYLIDNQMLEKFQRIPINKNSEISLPKSDISEKKSIESDEEIICKICNTKIDKREKLEYCPYCGNHL